MINKDGHLVDYKPLNQFLMSQNAYKIEKWSKFASETDVHNGIRFAHIYRVYFNEKADPISEIKTKLETETKDIEMINTPIEKTVIKKQIKTPIKLKKEQIAKIEEKFENLPTQKIKPKIKPKPIEEVPKLKENTDVDIKMKAKPKPEPTFNIASMLKDLRNDKNSLAKEDKEEKKENKKNELSNNLEKNNEIAQLSISEIDLLIQQLSSCWNAPAGAVIKKGMVVRIEAKVLPDRRILDNSVRIIDTNI